MKDFWWSPKKGSYGSIEVYCIWTNIGNLTLLGVMVSFGDRWEGLNKDYDVDFGTIIHRTFFKLS